MPLIPAYIRWEDDSRLRVTIEAPLETVESENEKAIADLTAQATARVEEWVRRYPEQWLWLHRRWKTRPPEEARQNV